MQRRIRKIYRYVTATLNVVSARHYVSLFKKIKWHGLAVLVLVFSLLLSGANASTTSAKNISNMNPSEQMKSWLYYNAISACINNLGLSGGVNSDRISDSDAKSGKWFSNPPTGGTNVPIGYFLTSAGVSSSSPGEKVGCGGDNVNWILDAATLWGYKSPVHLLCDTGASRVNKSDCVDGSEGFHGVASGVLRLHDKLKLETFRNNIKTKVYNGNEPSRSDAAQYLHFRGAFYLGCLRTATPSPYTGGASDDYLYTVNVVDPATGGSVPTKFYGKLKSSDSIGYSISPGMNNISASCGEIAQKMNDFANSYKTYIDKKIATDGEGEQDDTTKVCTGQEDCDTPEGSSSCQIEGVGWIVCPIVNFMAGISDGAFGVITYFLEIRAPLLDTTNGTYTAWQAFRNIANVAFVIVFLIIIFSQLTGLGVSNYGVKKTLPRLVIAAILVNISFFVCQLAVDITQILGASIKDFLMAINVSPAEGTTPPPSSWVEIMGDILAGAGIAVIAVGVAAGVAATIALSISSAVLLAVLIAVLMTVVILIGRQAAIVMLIVLSPLAFVAFLLPNTESWFKKWYKMFIGLLMVYPIIAILYGGGALASKILSNVATDSTGADRLWLSIIALGVSALPLIMTPVLLKGALNATGTIGAKLSNIANKANRRVGRSAVSESRLGEVRQGLRNRAALSRANARANRGYQRAIDNSKLGRALGLDKGTARAISAVEKEESAEVDAAVSRILNETSSVDRLSTQPGVTSAVSILREAIQNGDTTRARAAQKVLLSSGSAGIQRLEGVLSDTDVADNMLQHKEMTSYLRSDINSAGLKGKNNALARWGFQGSVDSLARSDPGLGTTLSQHAETFTKLNSVELAGQSIESLDKGEASSAISATAATAVLNNTAAAALLDDKKRALFTRIASAQPTTDANGPANRPDVTEPRPIAGNLQDGDSVPVRDTEPTQNTPIDPPQTPQDDDTPLPPTQ